MQRDSLVRYHAPEADSQPNGSTIDDEATVRDLFRQLLDAWGRGDGQAYGSLFTEDADYVAFDGSRTRGSQVIASTIRQAGTFRMIGIPAIRGAVCSSPWIAGSALTTAAR